MSSLRVTLRDHPFRYEICFHLICRTVKEFNFIYALISQWIIEACIIPVIRLHISLHFIHEHLITVVR